jgi:elongation factor G
MTKHNTADLRNVVLVGHGAVGKTTLADLMLFKAGIASRAGSVDDGSSLIDTDDDEKERKYSITSSLVHFEHAGKRINVIDAPGYPDFIGQAVGAMRAVETAVVTIGAGSGVEVNTRRCFGQAEAAGIARMILINKCDADNIDFPQLLESIQETFGQRCVPLNLPIGLGESFSGVVSTLNVPETVPDGVPIGPAELNQSLMDAIVEADEELMERYLEGEELSADEVTGSISKAMAAGTLIPIFCTSSKADVGVTEFMDALANMALAPGEITRQALNEAGEETELAGDADGPLVAQVFKTRIDPFVAKMSYIRVYSGQLKKDSSVDSTGASRALKIGQLLDVQGATQDGTDLAGPGDIVAMVKMEELHTGDTLTKDASGVQMPPILFPKPMVGLAVEPKSQADQSKISGALQKIVEEDPTFQITRDQQTKEMVVHGMSELHLLIIQNRLHARDKVEIITHQPKIPYREAVTGSAEGHYRHKKQSGGSGQFGEVHFKISACPHDIDPDEYFVKSRFESLRTFHYDPKFNACFIDRISGGSVPNQFIPAIEKGMRERMDRGVIAGFQVQDVVCELFFGKDHPVDSNETAFKMAASMCFRNVFQEAKPVLLEPIVTMEITVPADKLGDISSDLNTRRGRMEGMNGAPGGYQVLHAKAPLAEVMTYARSLSSMTGGQGSFTMEISHYEVVPPNEQAKIVGRHKKGGDDEEES